MTTADERRNDGADAITRWADATAPPTPDTPNGSTTANDALTANTPVNRAPFPDPRTKPLTDQVVWWLQAHADRDLTVDNIRRDLNELRGVDAEPVTTTHVQHALYAIRQRHGDYPLRLELGGYRRRGHVRWWTNPRQRPTPDRKERRVKEVAAARRKRTESLKQLDVPTPTPPEPTPTFTEYIELGVLTDGAVVLMANGDLYLATRYRPVTP